MLSGSTDDGYLSLAGDVRLVEPWVRTKVPDREHAKAELLTDVENRSDKACEGVLRGEIRPGGIAFSHPVRLEAGERRTIRLTEREVPGLAVEHPQLWWPNGMGDPALYTCRLVFETDGRQSDARTVTFGIREYGYEWHDGIFRLKINGEPVYVKGGNWGMSEWLLRCRGEEYDTRVALHRHMHFNMLRNWIGSTTDEEFYAACARHGLMDERPAEKVERLLRPEPMTLAAAEKTIAMPIAKSCFGLGFKEEPLPFGDLRSEMLYELILCCICGGMSPLYRRLYDEGLTNPGFGGEVLRVDGCCCIRFTGESDQPDTVRQLLLDEIERVRKEGVDREIFTLCKNEKYGQLIENLENVEDSASQMADFALAGQTVAQQITMLAGLTAEDADAALQHILCTDRMATMYIQPDGTAPGEDDEEEEE